MINYRRTPFSAKPYQRDNSFAPCLLLYIESNRSFSETSISRRRMRRQTLKELWISGLEVTPGYNCSQQYDILPTHTHASSNQPVPNPGLCYYSLGSQYLYVAPRLTAAGQRIMQGGAPRHDVGSSSGNHLSSDTGVPVAPTPFTEYIIYIYSIHSP